jgi:hypothetical protein
LKRRRSVVPSFSLPSADRTLVPRFCVCRSQLLAFRLHFSSLPPFLWLGGVAISSGLDAVATPSCFVGAFATLGLEDAVSSLLSIVASLQLLAGASSLLLVVAAAISCLGEAVLVFAAFIPCPCSACVELLPGFWG